MANEWTYGMTLADLISEGEVTEEELFGDDDSAEQILNDTIQNLGFEDPRTISMAMWIERGDVSIVTLRATLQGWLKKF